MYVWGETFAIPEDELEESKDLVAFKQTNTEKVIERTPHGELLIEHPFYCSFKNPVEMVSAGFDHILLTLQNDQYIYAQGLGKQGELGLGDITKSKIFKSIIYSWWVHQNFSLFRIRYKVSQSS